MADSSDHKETTQPDDPDHSALLRQAELLVEGFCQQLRDLLQLTRQRQQALETETRQLHRFLDELEVRLHLSQEGPSPELTNEADWSTDLEEARWHEQAILAELSEVEAAGRRIDLLLRQVEMSGHSLHGNTQVQAYDPWELALRSQILYGREQERIALAREVHDGPAQVLSNLTLGLGRCHQGLEQGEDILALLPDLMRDTRLGLQEVRRFIYDLRPSPLAEESLERQIERYIRDFEATYQVTVEFRWDIQNLEVSPEEMVAVYRIVQEGLRNAQKHARAERIVVEVYQEAVSWIVRVLDNGVGFDPNVLWRGEDHWGIVGMRERARLIGADLQIDSQLGEGTVVLLRLPLPRDNCEERP